MFKRPPVEALPHAGRGPGLRGTQSPARSLLHRLAHVAAMPKFTDDRLSEDFPGSALTPEQIEFGAAMERYMRLRNRRFPTWHEVLDVLFALGYRKVVMAPKEPRPHSE